MTTTETVDILKKVALTVTAGSGPGESDLTGEPVPVSFIFGLGIDGLTPFEYQLAGKTAGEEVEVPVERHEMGRIFCHLNGLLPPLSATGNTVHITARVDEVAPAEGREVVQAMALMSQCGGEAGCGCGCGGH
jgi:hypothetical protein